MTDALAAAQLGAPPGAPLVEVREVSKTYGSTRALSDVSFSVAPGRTHALVGRNGAGKSTLVSVMTGLAEPDEGGVYFEGEAAPSTRTPARWQEKVACVYQHRRIVPHLSVTENLLLNRLPRSRYRIDWAQAHRTAGELLAEWDIDLDPKMSAAKLGVEESQLVEIVRALSGGSRLVILDEPTAQLVASGVRRLFRELVRLQQAGVTFVFISHHLEEIDELCQDVTVLRNGQVVASDTVEAMPTSRIVDCMVGGAGGASRRSQRRRPDPVAGPAQPSAPVLGVEHLVCDGLSEPFSLEVHPGEIVGLAGHAGSGTREVAEAVFALRPITGGSLERRGRPLTIDSPGQAVRAGIAYVPEDRHAAGYVPMLSIEDNIATSVFHRLGRGGLVSERRRRALAETLCSRLDVASSSTAQTVGSLSGGNQQKVVLARALATEPEVLVLVHPTAGVDVASKETLFDAVDAVRRDGVGVLLVSDEVDELKECDRVVVMVQGRQTRTFDGDWHDRDMVAAMEGVDERV